MCWLVRIVWWEVAIIGNEGGFGGRIWVLALLDATVGSAGMLVVVVSLLY